MNNKKVGLNNEEISKQIVDTFIIIEKNKDFVYNTVHSLL
jgi:hypothetical protein